MNSAKSRLVKMFCFCGLPFCGNPAIDFLAFGETAVNSPRGWFSLWANSWSLLQTCLYADRLKLCHWIWLECHVFLQFYFWLAAIFCNLSALMRNDSESHYFSAPLWNKPNTLFFYKQSIFDPRAKTCLRFSKTSPQKNCLVDGLITSIV